MRPVADTKNKKCPQKFIRARNKLSDVGSFAFS
jgi:hypothetical protein